MSDIAVRTLTEDEWQTYRQVRLAALEESPEAFVASHEQEVGYDEDFWRQRMRRSSRILAEREGAPVGIVSVGWSSEAREDVAELFGLWVEPRERGTGVAWKLVQAGADQARADGKAHLVYWVGTDNGRGVAFASSFGFRTTDYRRPMRVVSQEEGEEEMAMVLPLLADPGQVPSPTLA